MTIKIHAFPPSPRAFKVLWAANHLGIDYEFVLVDLTKPGSATTPEFLKLNPNGRMPVLQDGDYVLWESNAIVNYLASLKPDSGMLPAETKPRLQIEKWQFWESVHWDSACAIFAFERVVKPLFGRGEASESEIARGTQMMERFAKVLDGELARHRYVAGDKMTVADISIGASMILAEPARFPLEAHKNILRWKADLTGLPSWQKTAAMAQLPRAAA